jgi:hypothetical protein
LEAFILAAGAAMETDMRIDAISAPGTALRACQRESAPGLKDVFRLLGCARIGQG